MPTERRFVITAFFKSYSTEILERFFPLGRAMVKLAILFRSQIGSSWTLGSTKLTVHILIAAIWLFSARSTTFRFEITMPYLPETTA